MGNCGCSERSHRCRRLSTITVSALCLRLLLFHSPVACDPSRLIALSLLGQYIANRVSDKITSISDRIYVCRSGSAADTQAVSDFVRYYLVRGSLLVSFAVSVDDGRSVWM